MMRFQSPVTAILLLIAAAGPAFAVDLHVDGTSQAANPDGLGWATSFKYLQDALANAQPFDRIKVAQGAYHPDDTQDFPDTGNQAVAFVMRDRVRIEGGYVGLVGSDPDVRDPATFITVLSGDLADNDVGGFDDPSRFDNSQTVVNGGQGLDDLARLDGVTITAGYKFDNGAGVFIPAGSSPRLEGCTITGNWCFAVGGGIYIAGLNESLISGCMISGNEAIEGGGMAIGGNNGALRTQILNTTFNNNLATNSGGGGLAIDIGSKVDLTDCDFIDNTANNSWWGGGGLAVIGDSVAHLRGCRFIGNRTLTDGNNPTLGGAIATSHIARAGGGDDTHVIAVDCLFEDNWAYNGHGGAVYIGAGRTPTDFINCTFRDNRAAKDTIGGIGGAIFLECKADPEASNVRMTNCLLHNNQADDDAGAVWACTTQSQFVNCTISENNAETHGGIVFTTSPAFVPVVANCVLWGNRDNDAGTNSQDAQLFVSECV